MFLFYHKKNSLELSFSSPIGEGAAHAMLGDIENLIKKRG